MSLVNKTRRHAGQPVRPNDAENTGRDERGEETYIVDWNIKTYSQKVLEQRNRRGLEIFNNSTDTIWVSVNHSAAQNTGIQIGAGLSWEPRLPPKGAIHIIGNLGTQSVTVSESF